MLRKKLPAVFICLLLVVAAYVCFQWLTPRDSSVPSETADRQTPPVESAQESSAEGAQAQMPYADLLDKAREKWGIRFQEDEKREEWSVWKERIEANLSDYWEARRLEGYSSSDGFKKSINGVFMKKYKELWKQGTALADAPLPKDMDMEPDENGVVHSEITSVFDKDLGKWRPYEPTIYLNLSHMNLSHGEVVSWTSKAIRRVDGVETLTDVEEYRLIHRGEAPAGVRLIYIDQDGQELSPGARPEALDPHGSLRQLSDQQLRVLVEGLEQRLNNPTPAQVKRRQEMTQTPRDRLSYADSISGLMAVWAERPSAWAIASPSNEAALSLFSAPSGPAEGQVVPAPEAEEESRPPLQPPPAQPGLERPPFEKPSMDPPREPSISAPELEVLLDAIKREQSGEGLTHEERSLLRLKQLYDLYESEADEERRRRLRRGSEGPPLSPEER